MDEPKELRQRDDTVRYDHPAGGWGSLRGIAQVIGEARPSPGALDTLMRQNKPGGHMCTSCAWTKPAKPHAFEFCENGAKATLWDLTRDRCDPGFFERHTLTELRSWTDHALEKAGRLTHPLRYDAARDRYLPCSWDEAFEGIAAELHRLPPEQTVFYTSGRASLEAAFLFQLYARLYGHNNLPDSSNMCHETTSVGLKKVIGSSVGTCVLSDFDHCDLILFFGQNTGTNSPRFLHPLKSAVDRGCRIITFNPLRERGLVEFADPQNPAQMTVADPTRISQKYLQVRPGGDIAAMAGLCKRLFEMEDTRGGVLDHEFLQQHCTGMDAFASAMREASWDEIEKVSGLRRVDLEEVAEIYATSERVVGIYGMGLTQHVHGWLNVAMLVNLLLLRGNIGREGAGVSPVRGHSNVQGQRTVGISEKPELVPLDKLAEMFDFTPPRETGRTTVEAVEGLLDGSVKGFVSLGGNFARAIPDQGRSDSAWSGLDLSVNVATKLNRSHVLVGRSAWLLPCLVRSERDGDTSPRRAVSMEDSLSHVHGSVGRRAPAAPDLRSEIAIIGGLAKATLAANPKLRWDDWTDDHGLIRDLIAEAFPDMFHDFNARLFTPGGFYRGNPARDREWKTESGRAELTTPEFLCALGETPEPGGLTLVTLRSNDQFNTTIYGFSDRLRGIEGGREVVLINPEDMQRLGLAADQRVTLESTVEDGTARRIGGLRVVPYDLPDGCVAAYYPEVNPLVPLSYHDKLSKTPAYKGVPVRIVT
ncbi:FdhF/YdeP family oxidoreductase [Salipiger marinus]|uniref:Oxidoreductase alpha (Molybdopterin) subunit n=1 Tax=Salipiger marinus TaxID=555512 RepID=A0A1G8L0E5_9RHOB|nr:FdhF/YdeP family oxidoreductase [Salipiger marinus]SDI49112.1 oxidoreductase alpha (molybdopterin) subunit [Salipiger marinus]